MCVAKTFSRTAREGAGLCPAVVCGDVGHSRVAYVQKEERESNLTAMLFSLRELGVDMKLFSSCFELAQEPHYMFPPVAVRDRVAGMRRCRPTVVSSDANRLEA